jgi:hypothetical protein
MTDEELIAYANSEYDLLIKSKNYEDIIELHINGNREYTFVDVPRRTPVAEIVRKDENLGILIHFRKIFHNIARIDITCPDTPDAQAACSVMRDEVFNQLKYKQ